MVHTDDTDDSPAVGLTRVSGSHLPWPVHSAQASRETERAALGQHAPHALMERAGQSVARLAHALAPNAGRFQVWVGPGNNGGDGLVAARRLHAAARCVQVSLVGDATRLPTDAALALQEAQAAGVPIDVWTGEAAAADWHLDALLGLGANRAPEGPIAEAIRCLCAQRSPVLAVDLPSGLHADTGMPLGEAAIRAQHTVALLTLKPGCHTGQGRDHAGTVWLDRLGVEAGAPTAWLCGAPHLEPRRQATHKGSFGDVAVVGGALGMVGAAWLAARAALAAGAGRVYVSLLAEDAADWDTQQPELMARRRWWLSEPAALSQTTVVCGCGGGEAVRESLPPLLSHAGRLVLDADALNAIAADPALLALLRRRAQRDLPTLLTPHPLEAARLLGSAVTVVQQDRLGATLQLGAHTGATVLLKGSGTVIAAPGQTPLINPTGGPALATAGTGDVLAGWAGGLWAQSPWQSASEMAAASAWLHGRAADRANCPGGRPSRVLQASDLVRAMATLTAP